MVMTERLEISPMRCQSGPKTFPRGLPQYLCDEKKINKQGKYINIYEENSLSMWKSCLIMTKKQFWPSSKRKLMVIKGWVWMPALLIWSTALHKRPTTSQSFVRCHRPILLPSDFLRMTLGLPLRLKKGERGGSNSTQAWKRREYSTASLPLLRIRPFNVRPPPSRISSTAMSSFKKATKSSSLSKSDHQLVQPSDHLQISSDDGIVQYNHLNCHVNLQKGHEILLLV